MCSNMQNLELHSIRYAIIFVFAALSFFFIIISVQIS